jgi:hypothetical protein
MSQVLSAETLAVLSIVSGVVLVGSVVGLPIFLVRIPPDHFQKREKTARSAADWCWKIGKNCLGVVLVVAGGVMLPLPGPGSLVLVVGLSLLDIPGRARLVRAIVSRPRITRFINWLRAKFGRPPLLERQADETSVTALRALRERAATPGELDPRRETEETRAYEEEETPRNLDRAPARAADGQ